MVSQLPCSYIPALVCVHIKRHKIVKRKQQYKVKRKNFKDKKKRQNSNPWGPSTFYDSSSEKKISCFHV